MKVKDKQSHKFADIFPMIEGEELERLKEDIREHGLLQPIVMYEDKILDGRNRYVACKEIGLEPRFEDYKGSKPLEWVISLNLKRRHLNESQRIVVASRLATMKRGKQPLNSSHELLSQKQSAKVMKVSVASIKRFNEIERKAPEEIHNIVLGKTKVGSVYRTIKLKEQRDSIEENVERNKTEGNFDVIVIDPPWDYGNDKNYNPESFRGTCPYPVMTQQEIREIKLPSKDDCVLWLWTTNQFLHEAMHLIEHWGFTQKSILTWDKEHMAIGKWLRSQTEHCILAIKGKPFYNNTKYPSLLREKRTTHSAKPDSFYTMVDSVCAGRKLDYFARKPREGWEVFGDEI